MPSKWGKRNDLPGFDKFRTGLTYREVYEMLRTSTKHKQKRRGSVLGFWHEMKLMLYYRAVDMGLLDRGEAKSDPAASESVAQAAPADEEWWT